MIVDVVEGVDLLVDELAVAPLDLADINRLDHVARCGIDADLAARAVERERFECRHRLVAVDLTLELGDHVIDAGHPVIARDRHEIGMKPGSEIFGVIGDVFLVHRVVERPGIILHRIGADLGVARRARGLGRRIEQVGRAQKLRAGRLHAGLHIKLRKRFGLVGAGKEQENRLRLGIGDALHVSGEVELLQRHADLARDLAPGLGEGLLEGIARRMTRDVVGDDNVAILDAVRRRPLAQFGLERLERRGDAHEIGRGVGDRHGGSVHHHGRRFRLGDQRRDRKGGRAEIDAGDEIDLVAGNQLLCELFGALGIGARLIALQNLDLLARDMVAMLAHIGLDAVADLLAEIPEHARELRDDADLDRVLGAGWRRRRKPRRSDSQKNCPQPMITPLHCDTLPRTRPLSDLPRSMRGFGFRGNRSRPHHVEIAGLRQGAYHPLKARERETPMFLMNQWYAAALGKELGPRPLARTICDVPVVMFRTETGKAAALDDRCPHRYAPLSAGECRGEIIACAYHGIEFGADGACTLIPHQPNIPPKMRVRSYPFVERWGWAWIWLGDPLRADPSTIPDYAWFGAAGWHSFQRHYYVKANWEICADNLLDL